VIAPAQREKLRHPLRGGSHPSYWKPVALILLFGSLAGWAGAQVAKDGPEKKKGPPRVVISGMVFRESGFSLPGASIRVHRAGERKARWEAVSDRQGEFGLWVPQGAEYEVHVKAKGYEEQTQKVDGKSNLSERLVFHMTPATAGKKP